MAGQNKHNTLVTGLPAYFVTNDRLDFYFYMKNDQTTRHPKLLYISENRVSFRSFHTASSCVSALFMNDVTQVHNSCSFILYENHLQMLSIFFPILEYYLLMSHLCC